MHGKDSYGNPWINPPASAPEDAAGPEPPPPEDACAIRAPVPAAPAPDAGVAPADLRTVSLALGAAVEAPPPPPGWSGDHLPGAQPVRPLPGLPPRVCHAWLGFDSRDGRLLAGDTGPLTSGAIKFGEVREIVTRPQVPFRGRWLWVHSACASSFLIHSVRVGYQIAGVATAPVPAEIFAVDYGEIAKVALEVGPNATLRVDVHQAPADMPRGPLGWRGIPFDLPPAQVGVEIAIMVENIERKVFEPIRFLAAFLGEGQTSP